MILLLLHITNGCDYDRKIALKNNWEMKEVERSWAPCHALTISLSQSKDKKMAHQKTCAPFDKVFRMHSSFSKRSTHKFGKTTNRANNNKWGFDF